MFFEDLCTVNEIHAMTQRWQVAKLLAEKKTYSESSGIWNEISIFEIKLEFDEEKNRKTRCQKKACQEKEGQQNQIKQDIK